MSDELKIAGVPIKVVSDEEANAVDYLVCMPWGSPTPFTDNLKGVCSGCGITVMYRWHAPLKPKRICVECMTTRVKAEASK